MTVLQRAGRTRGRRRTAVVCSVALVAIGASYLVTQTASRAAAFAWIPDTVLPGIVDAGWLLVLAGVGLAYSAWRPRCGTPFAVAAGVLLVWSLCFLVAWGFDLAEGRSSSTQWVSALSYGVWALLIGDEADRTVS